MGFGSTIRSCGAKNHSLLDQETVLNLLCPRSIPLIIATYLSVSKSLLLPLAALHNAKWSVQQVSCCKDLQPLICSPLRRNDASDSIVQDLFGPAYRSYQTEDVSISGANRCLGFVFASNEAYDILVVSNKGAEIRNQSRDVCCSTDRNTFVI